MPTDEKVEKVARAIAYAAYRHSLKYDEVTARALEEKEWPDFVPQARAALEAAEAGAVPAADEPRPKHLCQMIRDGLAAGACLAIAEPDEDGFLVRSLILPADEVEEMLRLAEGTGVTQALADLRRQLHHAQAELMLSASPPSEASREERAAIRKEAFEEAARVVDARAETCIRIASDGYANFARSIATAIRARAG